MSLSAVLPTRVGLSEGKGSAKLASDKEAALAALEQAFIQERIASGGTLSSAPSPDDDGAAWADLRVKMAAHVRLLATELGVPETVTPRNGDMVRLAPGPAAIIDEVPNGRLFVDGGMLVPEQGEALRERRHASTNGVIVVSFAMDRRGKIVSDIDVRGIGLPGDEESPLGDALDELAERARRRGHPALDLRRRRTQEGFRWWVGYERLCETSSAVPRSAHKLSSVNK